MVDYDVWQYEDALLHFLGDIPVEDASYDEKMYLLDVICWTENPTTVDQMGLIAAFNRLFKPPGTPDMYPRIPTPQRVSDMKWLVIKDGDARGRALYERHYTGRSRLQKRRRDGTKLFVGPGFKLVLLTPKADALFVWRQEKRRMDGQVGVECAVFRNEGPELSSELILRAEYLARHWWPHATRFFTFVNATAVRSSNPGYCFLKAGWRRMKQRTKMRHLVILEKMFPPLSIENWFFE